VKILAGFMVLSAVDTVINVKVILIGLTSEVKRPPLA
jgi:hypothetical protein